MLGPDFFSKTSNRISYQTSNVFADRLGKGHFLCLDHTESEGVKKGAASYYPRIVCSSNNERAHVQCRQSFFKLTPKSFFCKTILWLVGFYYDLAE
jgi:hypothetical protein